jgi:DGQHR domain-containing protein
MKKAKTIPNLHPLLTDPPSLTKEYTLRINDYDFIAVSPKNEQAYIDDGWSHDRKLKKRIRLKKSKKPDEILENNFWCLLYKMGYPEMNQGRTFKIKYKRKGVEDGEKQIDIFAKDDETVVIAECKSSEDLKKRNLQLEIGEFSSLQKPLADSIKKHYSFKFKPKILWLFVTDNIIWSQADRDRAKSEHIRIITEREFKYYKQIVDHLGPAAKYQFLAEYFQGQSIPEMRDKKIPAIRGKLGGKVFYCFVASPKQLLKISFVNHRDLLDPEGYPTYQRLIKRHRLSQIGNFLINGGFFPTNILINFNKKVLFKASYKDDENNIHFGYLYLPDEYKSAWIIDGQHRLYAYSKLEEKFMNQNLIVLAFEGLPREEEANLFVTINHEQKSVSRKLLDDLEGDLKWKSDKLNERIGAISSRLCHLLNSEIGGPFYNRFTTPGIRATERTCLTVPEIKGGIKLARLVGQPIMKMKVFERGPLCGPSDEETLSRAQKALTYYFSKIKEANSERWEKGGIGYLCTNPGIRGYLRLLAELIKYMESETKLDAKELSVEDLIGRIINFLQPILSFISSSKDIDFELQFKVKPGSGGQREYFYRLCRIIRENYPNFSPTGYDEWEFAQSEYQKNLADNRIKELEKLIKKHLFDKFKEIYKDDYFEKGVTDIDMKTKAYKQSLDDEKEKRAPLEAYLDFIDIKKIVENKRNWPLFKDIFNIPLPGVKGEAKNLAWMDRFNKLRRIPAHPHEHRYYRKEDFAFLEYLEKEFNDRSKKLKTIEDFRGIN